MRGLAGLAFLTAAMAQELAPIGMVRGTMLDCTVTGSSGSLLVRTPEEKVYRFAFDSRTYFERERRRVTATRLHKGDPLEIVSDRGDSPSHRYARIIHVLDDAPAVRFSPYLDRIRQYRSALEHIMPRGTLTYAGIISKVTPGVMLLRIRGGNQARILLRPDTRFLHGGSVVEVSALVPSMRVFVRAGHNLDNEVEAYQVVWGEILTPRLGY